jgi:hypothetical protein
MERLDTCVRFVLITLRSVEACLFLWRDVDILYINYDIINNDIEFRGRSI